jgi:hypothetical protein
MAKDFGPDPGSNFLSVETFLRREIPARSAQDRITLDVSPLGGAGDGSGVERMAGGQGCDSVDLR